MNAEHSLEFSSGRRANNAHVPISFKLVPPTKRGNRAPHPNRFCIAGEMAFLFCGSPTGAVFGVRIDKADLVRVLKAGPWRVANFDRANGRTNLYAYAKINGKSTYLHRFILDAPPKASGLEVDHIHQRTLDCRRSELRLTTKSENQRNRRDNHKRWARRPA